MALVLVLMLLSLVPGPFFGDGKEEPNQAEGFRVIS